jgi:hypothetical protein
MLLPLGYKVGGLLGIGGTVSLTEITFDKNWYFAGEECNVNLLCDNSLCASGVKSFKLKLKRKTFCRGQINNEAMLVKTSKYIY